MINPKQVSLIGPATGTRLIGALSKVERSTEGGHRRGNRPMSPHVGIARVKNGTPSGGRYTAVFLSTTDGATFTEIGDCYLVALNGETLVDEAEYVCLIAGIHSDDKPIAVTCNVGAMDCADVIDCVEAETGSLAEGCLEVVTDVACVDGSLVVTTTYLRGPGLSSSSTPCA